MTPPTEDVQTVQRLSEERRSGHPTLTKYEASYAYLLGLYLGDGDIWRSANGRTYALRLTLDASYPWIIISAADAIEDIHPRRRPHVGAKDANCAVITSYWKCWPCLFPQHGPGRKHHRRIALVAWQQEIVDREPERFLRGLIQSDGWRGTNRVHSKGRNYAYPRYQFSNRSPDIRRLFTDTCERIGIAWRPWGKYHVSVARRASVARLDEFIGMKC